MGRRGWAELAGELAAGLAEELGAELTGELMGELATGSWRLSRRAASASRLHRAPSSAFAQARSAHSRSSRGWGVPLWSSIEDAGGCGWWAKTLALVICGASA